MLLGEFKVDIFSEIKRIMAQDYQLFIVDQTVDELNQLIESGTKTQKFAAKLGLKAISTYTINSIDTSKDRHVDLLIHDEVSGVKQIT